MLMPLFAAVPRLPARSVADPVADRFEPSAPRITGRVTDPGVTPDKASVAVNDTVTGLLFHPFALGAGEADGVTTGGVRSMLTCAVAVADFPARSVVVPAIVWLAPSVVTTWSAGHDTIPEPGSVQVKCAVTGPLFHPFAFGCGDSDTVIDGGPRTVTATTSDKTRWRTPLKAAETR